jgi:hypothetical protein
MNVNIMMGHVNDLQNLKGKEAMLRECLSWVRHWQADVAGNLKPTPDSLAMMEAKLVAILQPVEAPEAAE